MFAVGIGQEPLAQTEYADESPLVPVSDQISYQGVRTKRIHSTKFPSR